MAASVKPLFRAISGQGSKEDARQGVMGFPAIDGGKETRDPLDYDPTPPSATEAFLREEMQHIRRHGDHVWETAVGAGHIAGVLEKHGFAVHANDVTDRGWPGVEIKSFFDFDTPSAPVQITNPPYCEISARDGHGRWLKHSIALGIGYTALLLNADWPAARINGFDMLFEEHPPSVEYLCCWKIDFRGKGHLRNETHGSYGITTGPALGGGGWIRKRLYKDAPDTRQTCLL